MESKPAYSGLDQYGPAFQDHLHATPRNARLTVDTDSQRTMTWEAPPSWSLTTWAGLQGANVPVPDPWITGYVVERREFRARADGYLYFLEAEDTPIWSATMIAREGFRDGIVILGYRGGAFGSLSEDEFNHASGRYQVLELSHGGGSQNTPPTLELTIDGVTPPHVAEDWVLVIDGTDFPLADALVQYPIAGRTLITWNTSAIVWTNLQQVSVQMVDRRDRYGWERLRRGRDGDTSTAFTDNEQANGRKFVYRIRTANTRGISTNRAIFDWLWDSPHRDAVVDLAATGTPPERTKPTLEEYPAATRSIPGNTPAGRAIGAPLSATDADNDLLFYSLGGPDGASFDLDASSGQLWTTAALAGSGRTRYRVLVSVSDGLDDLGNPENPPVIDATTVVTITVATASTSGSGGGGGGGGGGGFGPAPVAPKFADGFRTERPLAVTARPGDAAGDPVAATHPEDLGITYSLSGADAASFTVDAETGQIRVKEGVELELGQTYTVNLTATDSAGFGAIIIVVIQVTEGLGGSYDLNRDGVIDKHEVLRAVSDYFAGLIEKDEVLALVARYFAG